MSTPRGLRASPALRSAREARGWSMAHFAAMIGCTRRWVSDIETGKGRCSEALADRIRRVFSGEFIGPSLRLRRDANRRAAARFRARGFTGWLATEAAAAMYDKMIRQHGDVS